MNKLKESNTPNWLTPIGGWKLWFAKLAVGVLVLSLWTPLAALLGIGSPWVSILFVVGWVVFWMAPVGKKSERVLERMIRREG